MKNAMKTKHALAMSILSLVLCCAMLIGTTFAWFTDSATTGVNVIKSGNLKIKAFSQKTVVSGETGGSGDISYTIPGLSRNNGVVTFSGSKDDINVNNSIIQENLWEPGAVGARLLTVENVGNLAAKIKLDFLVNDNGLQDALWFDFIQVKDGNVVGNFTKREMSTLKQFASSIEFPLMPAGDAGDEISFILLYGMKEEAGNEYMEKSFEATVKILATQYTYEEDSFDKYYDINATYPVVQDVVNYEEKFLITVSGGGSTTINKSSRISVPAQAVAEDVNAVFSVKVAESTPDSVTYEISLKKENGESIQLKNDATVTVNMTRNLRNVNVYHDGTLMEEGKYTYNSTTGMLTIAASDFNLFKVTYEFDLAASVNGVSYADINSAIANAKDGDTVVVQDNIDTNNVAISLVSNDTKKVTLDLNGKTINCEGANQAAQVVRAGADLTIKNGTINSNTTGVAAFSGAKVTLENVNITSSSAGNAALLCYDSVTAVLKNCNLKSNYIGLFSERANNNIRIEGGTIESNCFGIYQNGSQSPVTIYVKDTKITDTRGTGIYISNGSGRAKQNLTLEGCTVQGPTAVEIKHTDAVINDSTLIATVPTNSQESSSGICTLGYALSVTTNGANDLATGTVSATGCQFQSPNDVTSETNGYCFVYQLAEGSSVSINGQPVTNFNTYKQ